MVVWLVEKRDILKLVGHLVYLKVQKLVDEKVVPMVAMKEVSLVVLKVYLTDNGKVDETVGSMDLSVADKMAAEKVEMMADPTDLSSAVQTDISLVAQMVEMMDAS